jgi:hypothetical protein
MALLALIYLANHPLVPAPPVPPVPACRGACRGSLSKGQPLRGMSAHTRFCHPLRQDNQLINLIIFVKQRTYWQPCQIVRRIQRSSAKAKRNLILILCWANLPYPCHPDRSEA